VSVRVLVPVAAVVAAVVAPLALLGNAADEGSLPRTIAFLAQLAVFVGGGALAARRSPGQPLTHAALAPMLGWAIVQAVVIVVRTLGGDDVRWGTLPFLALFVGLTGMVGGIVSGVLGGRSRAT